MSVNQEVFATPNGYRARHYRSQDNLRIFFRDYPARLEAPDKIPLLCLPGVARNSKDFASLARRQMGARRVICPDYRGRGLSEYAKEWHQYQPPLVLGDIVDLLTSLNCHRVIACGTSFGGIMAMALAVRSPVLLAGVILNDVGPDVDHAGRKRVMGYIGRDMPQPDWPAAVQYLRRNFTMLSMESDADWLEFAQATFREGSDGQLHCDWDPKIAQPFLQSSGPAPDLWALFRALKPFPLLTFRGEISDILTPRTFERMAQEVSDHEQVTVPAVGHAPSLAEPVSREAISAFLGNCDKGAKASHV
jgi:pimeloyl-ACP methyl ester carboxylesterase